MMSLRAKLENRSGDTPLWLLPGERTITLGGLRTFLCRHAAFLGTLAGKRVALKSDEQSFLAIFLVALDGLCGQILLVPEMSGDDRAAELLAVFQPECVLEYSSGVFTVQSGGTAENVPLEIELSWSGNSGESPEDCHPVAAVAHHETQWVIPTSGTTGPPRLVKHTLRTLTRSVKTGRKDQSDFCWGLLYSLTRFAGLQVFLQALLSGSRLVLCDQKSSLEQQLSGMAAAGCNALSATPTMWRKILMTPIICGTALRQITLGGEIADQQILNALRHRFPEARITHIYASTEAGVGFSVTDGKAGFPAVYLDAPQDSTAVRVSPDGLLMLRPSNPAQEYVGGERVFDDEGWVNTGDLVTRSGDRFCFLGRDNGCINVGGNKVHPEEVEQVLRDFPGIIDARVRGRKNPFTGFLVTAEVIIDKEIPATKEFEKSIIVHCRERLEPYKIPAIVSFVPSFPISMSGKVERG